MSEIEKEVMKKIKSGEVNMRPKIYFVTGSFLMLAGIVGFTFFSVFLTSLISFFLKTHGPMGQVRLQQIISSFPWWAVILTILSLFFGIFLMKKFDFSYKKNFTFIVLVFVVGILLAGVLIDVFGFDNSWIKKGPMKRLYQRGAGSRWRNLQ